MRWYDVRRVTDINRRIKMKRLIDMFVALFFLILFSPVIAVVGVAVTLDGTGGPVWADIPKRIGKDGKQFFMYKFRSMIPRSHKILDKDSWDIDGHNKIKARRDTRITFIGYLIRFCDFDEVPQFLNVLKGDMSVVGPRPYLSEERDMFKSIGRGMEKKVNKVLRVKPGITGLWQVSGRNNLTLRQRLELDVSYVQNCSLLYDLWIMLKTPFVVLFRVGAW